MSTCCTKCDKSYNISEFAKKFQISRQTLIYYDKIDLFKPCCVGENQYRYYLESQSKELSEILQMRDAGLKLDDIKKVITAKNPAAIFPILDEQIKEIEKQIADLQEKKLIVHNRKRYYESMYGKYELEKIFEKEEKNRLAFFTPFDLSLNLQEMMDQAYKGCVAQITKFSDARFEGCGAILPRHEICGDNLYENGGVFFMVSNVPENYPGLIEISGGLKVEKYFYGNPGHPETAADVAQYVNDHNYEVDDMILLHNIVENNYIAGTKDLTLIEVSVLNAGRE